MNLTVEINIPSNDEPASPINDEPTSPSNDSLQVQSISKIRKIHTKKPIQLLQPYYDIANTFEIGLDEAGRGPLFGRLYVAATILPKDDSFKHADIKDSKRFSSKKKIKEVSDYIKSNSIVWSIQYIEAEEIDRINILQSVLKAMHLCIKDCIHKMNQLTANLIGEYVISASEYLLLVDGNQFKPYMHYNELTEKLECIRHEMI